ncbi:hypothetical protein AKJ48_02950 [candidate division MSBL1 archaeon SCGC-AAA261O19]|uniref:DDE domain-containing protein n=1 Tax=candidate division MSBL1 archaeon SCGC-AAA261O19 TaxID=1698277 RepID=A0A133VCZ6_9EURY|nr:hypothetical protein AKJ48_02950 [candidate division MSBL1 archaeon SCGC-AAA261O19]
MKRAAGATSSFTNGIFQADEMQIRSFGERLWIMGVRRSDGGISLNALKGDSGLEFKSSLKLAAEELGPTIVLDTDGHTSYPFGGKAVGGNSPTGESEERRIRQ